MTHPISKEILKPICEKLHKETKDFPLDLYSDEYKARLYRRASIIILAWEEQKRKIKGDEDV